MNLSGIDLNLLVALYAVLEERSVTGAAKRVGLTQPAMSHALNRLRGVLKDPILVRAGRRMALSQRAEALIPQVTALVTELDGLFCGAPARFDPAERARTFRVAASDAAQLVIFPALHALITEQAPRAAIRASPFDRADVVRALRNGEIDVAVGDVDPAGLPSEIHGAELLRDPLVVIMPLRHPVGRTHLDIEGYLALDHVAIEAAGRPDVVDQHLARRGQARRVALTVSSPLVAAYVVSTSQLFATLPARAARTFLSALHVEGTEAPPELPEVVTVMLWHHRVNADPAHQWLRGLLADASGRAFLGGRRTREALRESASARATPPGSRSSGSGR